MISRWCCDEAIIAEGDPSGEISFAKVKKSRCRTYPVVLLVIVGSLDAGNVAVLLAKGTSSLAALGSESSFLLFFSGFNQAHATVGTSGKSAVMAGAAAGLFFLDFSVRNGKLAGSSFSGCGVFVEILSVVFGK